MPAKLKDTLNLPRTDFPMRANLVRREPARAEHWETSGLYRRVMEKNAGGRKYVLHDGPPFTNGDLHLGHALNKTLKDTILRYKRMRGRDAPYVPGWDSHGLPIEHKVARELEDAGESPESPLQLREACERFAREFRDLQARQFQRLGVDCDWSAEYWTIHPDYEAAELETFARFVDDGLVYRRKKPVYWSIPCGTALAEAEVEYAEHRSPSIYVEFPLAAASAKRLGLEGEASVVIWTTTPWTLPANLAIAVHPDFEYSAIASDGRYRIVASELAETVAEACGLPSAEPVARWQGRDLAGMDARHPFIDRASPLLPADYVSLESGTGCVHLAPGHGLEDYQTGVAHGLEIYCPIDDAGRYVDDGRIPRELVGQTVLETEGKAPANVAVLEILEKREALLKFDFVHHTYPHCWRSKTPVVFRAMNQWFIALDTDGARDKALGALDEVTFIPAWGENRIRAAVQNRPDWCISRQRAWGVPLPAFYDADGAPYLDGGVVRAIAAKVAREGSDLWFRADAPELLEGVETPDHWPQPSDLTAGTDTLDVWIDSGCSHRAVLQRREALHWPADLYLEGSDQHRGWFQSSLWTGVVCDGAAPYKSILTHGFIVKEDGTKLSKSDGAARPLHEWIDAYGADIVRLWICSQDFRGDVPISDAIVRNVANEYRAIRNTLRFQLGNLYDFEPPVHDVPPAEMHALDRWALHEATETLDAVERHYDACEFHLAFRKLTRFCATTLSAAYHDILKDRLYTRAPGDPLRRSSQSALHRMASMLIRMLGPLLPFTADEAWSYFREGRDLADEPLALADWPEPPPDWRAPDTAADVRELRRFRAESINEPLEALRQNKTIGQSLDAKAILEGPATDPAIALLQRYEADLPELFILSQVTVRENRELSEVAVSVDHADGVRCPRSWRWVAELVETEEWGAVSPRCAEALAAIQTRSST